MSAAPALNVPLTHGAHDDDPLPDAVPGGHARHAPTDVEALSLFIVPPGHNEHTVEPRRALY